MQQHPPLAAPLQFTLALAKHMRTTPQSSELLNKKRGASQQAPCRGIKSGNCARTSALHVP
eukprot:4365735-Amphidinium_carterae.1